MKLHTFPKCLVMQLKTKLKDV